LMSNAAESSKVMSKLCWVCSGVMKFLRNVSEIRLL
jgi:hypothetical protein